MSAFVLSVFSLVIAITSAGTAIISVFVARGSSVQSKKISKRSGIFDLYSAWRGVEYLDPQKISALAAIKAANVLDLTASLWNHDVLEKDILFQSYWESYKEIYDALDNSSTIIMPDGTAKSGRTLLNSAMKRAYDDMDRRYALTAGQSTI